MRPTSSSFFMWCETVGCDSPSGSMRLHTQTGPSFVASTFMIRTRAGSPSARKSSAVASVSSSESSGAPSGAQQAIASASIGSQCIDDCRYVSRWQTARGRLAQLVERLLYTQEVTGSSPVPPSGRQPLACASAQKDTLNGLLGALASTPMRDDHFTPESYLAMMREA